MFCIFQFYTNMKRKMWTLGVISARESAWAMLIPQTHRQPVQKLSRSSLPVHEKSDRSPCWLKLCSSRVFRPLLANTPASKGHGWRIYPEPLLFFQRFELLTHTDSLICSGWLTQTSGYSISHCRRFLHVFRFKQNVCTTVVLCFTATFRVIVQCQAYGETGEFL